MGNVASKIIDLVVSGVTALATSAYAAKRKLLKPTHRTRDAAEKARAEADARFGK